MNLFLDSMDFKIIYELYYNYNENHKSLKAYLT